MEIKNNKITKGLGDNKTSNLSAKNKTSQSTSDPQNFRTLQRDMTNAVKTQDRSLAQMIIADKKRKREGGYYDKKISIENKHSNNIYKILFGFIIIVVIALFGIRSVWQEKEEGKELPREQISTAIISIDEQILLNTKTFTGGGQTFITAMNNALTKNKTEDGGILHLLFVKEIEVADEKTNKIKKIEVTLPVNEFFELWENNAPESLIRSFEKENYMFGFFNIGGKTEPFLLFKSKNFDQTYAGILEWENNLCKNAQNIFLTKKECPQYKFKNAQLLDTDIRVLEVESGKPAILYGFLDNENMLIITQSTAVFKEIKSLFD